MTKDELGAHQYIKYFELDAMPQCSRSVLVLPPLPALGITEGAIFDRAERTSSMHNTNNIIRMRTSLTEMGFQPPDDILNIGDRHPLWRHLNRYLTARQLTEWHKEEEHEAIVMWNEQGKKLMSGSMGYALKRADGSVCTFVTAQRWVVLGNRDHFTRDQLTSGPVHEYIHSMEQDGLLTHRTKQTDAASATLYRQHATRCLALIEIFNRARPSHNQ